MRARSFLVSHPLAAALLAATGCGAPPPSAAPPQAPRARPAPAPPAQGDAAFSEALAALAAHDAAASWSDSICTAIALRFARAYAQQKATALYNAAVAETRCDHESAALDYAKRAAAADPESAPARLLVAHLAALSAIGKRDFAGARRLLAAAIERDGRQEELLTDLANAHVAEVLATDRPSSAAFDLAKKACDEAAATRPRSVRPLLLRSALAAKERRFADARADLARAIALAPAERGLRFDAATLAATVRDFDAADKSYVALLSKDASDFEARLGRAAALRAAIQRGPEAELTQRYSAARDAVGAVIAVAPERPEGHLQFALLLLDHGWRRPEIGGYGAGLLAADALTRALELSRGKPEHAAVEKRARALYDELNGALGCSFPKQTEAERKAEEAEAKQRAAQMEAEAAPSP